MVWQHNSYKQNEYIDSWIVKGSGLIFFKNDFFEFICHFSNILIPALPQSAAAAQWEFPVVPSTASNSTLSMVRSLFWRRRWHWQNTACSCSSPQVSIHKVFFQCWDYSALGTTKIVQNRTDGMVLYNLSPSVCQHPAAVLTVKSSDVTTPLLTQWKEADPQKHWFQPHKLCSRGRQPQHSPRSKAQLCNSLQVPKLRHLPKATAQMTETEKGPIK